MSWSYNATTNTLTQDVDTTNDWHSAWVADKAGTLTLYSGNITADGTYSLSTAVRPADDLALPLTMSIDHANLPGGSVVITLDGLDHFGNAVSNNKKFTGDGSYTTTYSFASINASGITVAGITGGDFNLVITQPRWGVFWQARQTGYSLTSEQQYNKQFYCNATVLIGAGTITDANGTSANEGFDLVLACTTVYVNGTWNFGYLSDSQPSACWRMITLQGTDQFKIYGTLNCIAGEIKANARWRRYNGTWNFNYLFFQGTDGIESYSGIGNLTDLAWTQSSSVGFKCFATPTSATRVRMTNCGYGMQVLGVGTHPVFVDPIFANNSYDIIANTGDANRIIDLINPKNTAGDYITRPTLHSATSAVINVQFNFDLRVKDGQGNLIEGASWILWNDDYEYSGSTDAGGDITQQIVTSQVFDGAGSWTDDSEYELLIKKAGFLNYYARVTVLSRKNMSISLKKVKNLNFSKTTKILSQ